MYYIGRLTCRTYYWHSNLLKIDCRKVIYFIIINIYNLVCTFKTSKIKVFDSHGIMVKCKSVK